MDYSSSDSGALAVYAAPSLYYGESSLDRTFITNLSSLYELPGSSRLTNPILSTVLGHWNVSGIATFASGAPTNVMFSTVSGADLIGGGDGQRINISGNPQFGYGVHNGNEFFNTSVFSSAAWLYRKCRQRCLPGARIKPVETCHLQELCVS